ncbi:sensor histidine kinase [Paenactinomyces guangxiensis]|uniref:histidine kinase n=1 Tax=Paenactinomyces guangxiensis TaxID=1490290 RepID=A0A7W2A809_9BACL|nr:sensor histidine kinase [Paenactinomyces guangxiensis]MBA4494165.1 sensor histidine kinase [Paenactinomyces guangxiensis]MBH8591090.1 sensor histidine kinase [Paenactinomyces guangxiensis]
MVITVPLAGELKLNPFNDDYRVSFSIPVFFFFLLWIRKISPIFSGFVIGVCVVAFRMALELWNGGIEWGASFNIYFPSFLYYFIYGCLFYFAKINHFHHRPLVVGLLGVLVEAGASFAELLTRYSIIEKTITLSIIGKIIVIAVVRSFLVLGFFNLIKLRQEKEENEQKMMLISNLFEETIQLRKSLQNAEEITRDCYDLYRNLKHHKPLDGIGEYTQTALRIAGQVHEIKKDNQRIYAGLSRLISRQSLTDYMSIRDLGGIVIRTNQKYARLLDKNIQFSLYIEGYHPPYHIYSTLSLMNNLVSNAVESIREKGKVEIDICKDGEWLEFRVSDDGPGIPEKNQELIFKPGFTTKYDLSGKQSTGIGLSYVKEMVEQLNGTVSVQSRTVNPETVFVIRLPAESLVEKG